MENLVERALIEYRGKESVGTLGFNDLVPLSMKTEEHKGLPNQVDKVIKLDDVVSLYIRRVLELTEGKIEGVGGAARLLGIHPNTLRGRMDKLGILCKRKGRK